MKTSKFNPVEVALMFIALWWAIILRLPFDTFSNPAYMAMAALFPKYIWSFIAFIISSCHFTSMLIDNVILKKLSLFSIIAFFVFIAVMLFIGDLSNTGTGTYFILSGLASWIYWKVGERGD